MQLIFHADDFGITPAQSKQILACSSACGGNGALNSTSILVNSPHFEECCDLIEPFLDRIHVGVHLNVVEGHCCANPNKIPDLIDEEGVFVKSFAQLLAATRGRKNGDITEQLNIEVTAQIERFCQRFPQMRDRLRVDSHQHFHLIPAVFEAVLAGVSANGATLEYLRIPAEPVKPFLLTTSVWTSIPPVNVVKQLLLKALWRRCKSRFPGYRESSAVFCGLAFSGHMFVRPVHEVLPHLQDVAKKRDMPIELLFHPGGVDSPDSCLNPKLQGFVDFYTSPNRRSEARCLRSFERETRRERPTSA